MSADKKALVDFARDLGPSHQELASLLEKFSGGQTSPLAQQTRAELSVELGLVSSLPPPSQNLFVFRLRLFYKSSLPNSPAPTPVSTAPAPASTPSSASTPTPAPAPTSTPVAPRGLAPSFALFLS